MKFETLTKEGNFMKSLALLFACCVGLLLAMPSNAEATGRRRAVIVNAPAAQVFVGRRAIRQRVVVSPFRQRAVFVRQPLLVSPQQVYVQPQVIYPQAYVQGLSSSVILQQNSCSSFFAY
jgi:hypothetical protein